MSDAPKNWHERIRIAMESRQGQKLATQEIIAAVGLQFDGANKGNILPGDHCVSETAKSPCPYCQSEDQTIFRRMGERNSYLVIKRQEVTSEIRDIKNIEDRTDINETIKEALIKARLGQGRFRTELMKRWGSSCAVTGCNQREVLRASHIKPWRYSKDEERLNPSNGFLLSANIDALFDCGLISFNDAGEMLVSEALTAESKRILGLPGRLRKALSEEEIRFLSFHRAEVFSP